MAKCFPKFWTRKFCFCWTETISYFPYLWVGNVMWNYLLVSMSKNIFLNNWVLSMAIRIIVLYVVDKLVFENLAIQAKLRLREIFEFTWHLQLLLETIEGNQLHKLLQNPQIWLQPNQKCSAAPTTVVGAACNWKCIYIYVTCSFNWCNCSCRALFWLDWSFNCWAIS